MKHTPDDTPRVAIYCNYCRSHKPPQDFAFVGRMGGQGMCKVCSARRQVNPAKLSKLQKDALALGDIGFVAIDKDSASQKAYLANKKAAGFSCLGQLTAEDVIEAFAFFSSQCVYCGCDGDTGFRNAQHNPVGIDHVDPLSRGGLNTLENIVCCCRSCNSSKSNKDVRRWLVIRNRNVFRFEERFLEWQTHVYKRELLLGIQPSNILPFPSAATSPAKAPSGSSGQSLRDPALAALESRPTRLLQLKLRPTWMLKETELWLTKLAA